MHAASSTTSDDCGVECYVMCACVCYSFFFSLFAGLDFYIVGHVDICVFSVVLPAVRASSGIYNVMQS